MSVIGESQKNKCVLCASTERRKPENRAIAQSMGSSLDFQKHLARGLNVNKYGAKKTEIDGIVFDSRHEATRYVELKYMERAGLIKDLKLQERFCLIPAIDDGQKVIQRAVYYVADFTYYEKRNNYWKRVVEDAKGCRTDVYKLKKKLMRWKYGIEVKET